MIPRPLTCIPLKLHSLPSLRRLPRFAPDPCPSSLLQPNFLFISSSNLIKFFVQYSEVLWFCPRFLLVRQSDMCCILRCCLRRLRIHDRLRLSLPPNRGVLRHCCLPPPSTKKQNNNTSRLCLKLKLAFIFVQILFFSIPQTLKKYIFYIAAYLHMQQHSVLVCPVFWEPIICPC